MLERNEAFVLIRMNAQGPEGSDPWEEDLWGARLLKDE